MPAKRSMERKKPDPVRKNTKIVSPEDLAIQTLLKASPLILRRALKALGVGSKYFTCYMCGEIKTKEEMYASSDPKIKTGVTRICKECAQKIASGEDAFGVKHPVTKQTLCEALEYIDKPYIANVYDSADLITRQQKEKRQKADMWTNYMKCLVTTDGVSERWKDSEILQRTYAALEKGGSDELVKNAPDAKESVEEKKQKVDMSAEARERYEINKADVIRFTGYDPFADYKDETERARLYAQTISFLSDESSRDDAMKTNAVIQVVKAMDQAEVLNDEINALLMDKENALSNQAIINKMMATKKACLDAAQGLARDNALSVNFSKTNNSASRTLSGRIKKLQEIGFRDASINTFSINDCAGMRQVAEISEAARHKMIGYDEQIATTIKDIKVQLVESLTKERDEYKEKYRLALQQGEDLKQYCRDHGLPVDGKG